MHEIARRALQSQRKKLIDMFLIIIIVFSILNFASKARGGRGYMPQI